MPRRIEEDHKDFRDVVSGKIRKALQKFVKTGQMFKARSKGGKMSIGIPSIDIPHIVFGSTGEGCRESRLRRLKVGRRDRSSIAQK